MNAYSIIQRNPNFFLVWVGQVLSQGGARVYQMAVIWWILSSVQSGGTWLGVFMVMTALPGILFLKYIGKKIDSSKSKSVLATSDALSAIVISLVAFLLWKNLLTVPIALVFGFLGATLQAFIDPTLNKALSEVVSKDDFEAGLSLLASTQSLANFAGAVAGALLIDHLGYAGTALLAAGGYGVSSLASLLAKFVEQPRPETIASQSGWAILKDRPLLKKLLIGFGLVNFFATPTLVVLPVYTKRVLEGSATLLGTLEAFLWIGLLIGSIVSRYVFPKVGRIEVGVFCLSVFGLALATPGLVIHSKTYMIALFIAGVALGINNVKFMSFFQETISPDIKGRFFALMQGLIGFTFPIAYFLFGVLTDRMATTAVCLIQGAGVVALAFYFVPLRLSSSGGDT